MTPKDFYWEPLLLIIDELLEKKLSSNPRLSALRLLKENMLETNRFPTKLIGGYDTDAMLGNVLGDYIRKTG